MMEFRMPSLGADMESAILSEWRVKPGDRLKRGDLIAVVETDKGAIEVEFFEDGIVETLLQQPGKRLPVGTVLALVRQEGETIPPGPPPPSPPGLAPPLPSLPTVTPPAQQGVRAVPAARKLARELGIDLTTAIGSGAGGIITRQDVERAAQPKPPEALSSEAKQLAMRRAIAAAMSRANREIPHYYLGHSIDMTRAMTWLEEANQKRSVAERLIYAVLLLKAVARAVQAVPEMNGFWIDDSFHPSTEVHVGVAFALRGGGLVAPALMHADRMSLSEMMRALSDLGARARAGRLRSSEFTSPTLTVTNLGDRAVESVYGVIYPPQVALVGFGALALRPACVEGAVVPRRMIRATLSADHRASDGHRGNLFLLALARLLQEPESLEGGGA